MSDMPQAIYNWIWLALLVAITVLRKIHERRSGDHSRLAGTPVVEGVLMALWGIAAGVLPLFYVFGPWLELANLPFDWPPILGALGVVLFLAALWLLHRSHADLGRSWSPTVEPRATSRLVTVGVYRRIRHPMYSAHVVWGLAQALLLPNLLAGPLALAIMLAVLALRIPREERFMLEEFGEEYRDYMRTTGRLLPRYAKDGGREP